MVNGLIDETSLARSFILRQLKAGVGVDGVSQLLLQCTLPLVVGQLEEVEAGGGGGQPVDGVLAANGEEATQHRTDGVSRVLVIAHLHAANGKGRLEVGKAEEGRLGARGDELQKEAMLLHGEVTLENVPQPADDAVVGVEAAKVLGVPAQVLQVNGRVVAGDEPLKLRRAEHGQPLGVDDGAEAANEGRRLLVNLRVHAKVRHQVNVADARLLRHRDGLSAVQQLVRHNLPHGVLVHGEGEIERGDVALVVVLQKGQVLVQLRVEGGQLVNGRVQCTLLLTEHLAEKEGGKGNVHDDALIDGLA